MILIIAQRRVILGLDNVKYSSNKSKLSQRESTRDTY